MQIEMANLQSIYGYWSTALPPLRLDGRRRAEVAVTGFF